MQGLSPVVASGGHSSSRCTGLSLSRLLLLRSTGSRRTGSVIVAHGPSCSTACGIFPDQGSNLCPLHWQADSQPLRHQGSPTFFFYILFHYGLSQDIEYSSLCYTVGPCCLSILNVIVCIYQPQTPSASLSLPHSLPHSLLATTSLSSMSMSVLFCK